VNKNIANGIVVLLIAAAIGAFVFYIQGHTPKYRWQQEYLRKSEQPYGLKYMYDLLKDKQLSFISNQSFNLLDTNASNTNLIAIDYDIELDSANTLFLLSYVKNGNKAFISTEDVPKTLLRCALSLPLSDSVKEYTVYEADSIKVNYFSSDIPYPENLRFQYQYLKKITKRNWSGYKRYYLDSVLRNDTVTPVSFFNDTVVNCFYVQYGKGAFIFHSEPILFTNYNMIRKSGFKNANNVFSYLNEGAIYWNEYDNYHEPDNGHGYGSNPLKFLFSHYTLKAGWYLFLFSIFIYILFRSKREQRIIPVLYKNKNSSIDFAKDIGSLYYQKKAHHNIATEMYNMFLSDIRTRYNIITFREQKDLIEQVIARTEVDREVVLDLFKKFNEVKHDPNAKPKELVELYKALENFNKIKK
jgi:hypothetical protein